MGFGGGILPIVLLKLNDKEDTLIRKYAEIHNMDLSTFICQAVMEKIEDEYELSLFDKVLEEEQNKERISHEDLKKELGL
jgi:uncharacterized protein (DUF1778 family)